MLLEPGERVLRSAYAKLLEGHGPGIVARTAGVLYLTNHRCVFETVVSRGVVQNLVRGRDVVTMMNVALPALRNLVVQRPRFGKPRLLVEADATRASFDLLEPDVWLAAVGEARQALPSPYAPPPPATIATHTVERQVVKVRCRFCGQLGNEVDSRCSACGAPL